MHDMAEHDEKDERKRSDAEARGPRLPPEEEAKIEEMRRSGAFRKFAPLATVMEPF
jgi:hypothetical protein